MWSYYICFDPAKEQYCSRLSHLPYWVKNKHSGIFSHGVWEGREIPLEAQSEFKPSSGLFLSKPSWEKLKWWRCRRATGAVPLHRGQTSENTGISTDESLPACSPRASARGDSITIRAWKYSGQFNKHQSPESADIHWASMEVRESTSEIGGRKTWRRSLFQNSSSSLR